MSATGLPLIVAIATIGLDAHQMRSSTAAALNGAGMISVLVFPMIAMKLAPRMATTGNQRVDRAILDGFE